MKDFDIFSRDPVPTIFRFLQNMSIVLSHKPNFDPIACTQRYVVKSTNNLSKLLPLHYFSRPTQIKMPYGQHCGIAISVISCFAHSRVVSSHKYMEIGCKAIAHLQISYHSELCVPLQVNQNILFLLIRDCESIRTL